MCALVSTFASSIRVQSNGSSGNAASSGASTAKDSPTVSTRRLM
jgi:hypothetical protein